MHQDSTRSLSKTSMAFLSGTFLSRITGMVRDMAMAFCFGSASALASFLVAYRMANLLRRIFGESPLSSGFVPHYETLRKQDPTLGASFFRDVFFSLSFFLLFILALIELALIGCYHFFPMTESSREILYLSIIMLPGTLFICLFGLSSAFLQCDKKFFLTGFAPVGFNLVWIAAVFYFRSESASQAAIGLSVAMIVAFFFHWAILAPKIVKNLRKVLSIRQMISVHLFSTEVRKIFKPFFLGIIGIAAVQVNSALDAIFAHFASNEGPAYLWYSIRIEQLPIGLFGMALSSALLPPLSRAMTQMDIVKYKELLSYAMKKCFSLMFPCTIGLFVLGYVGVNFLYGRGDFNETSTYETVLCLWGYGIGLLPTIFIVLLAPAFFAKKNFRTPTLASALSVLVNVVLNYVFVFFFHWGALSIALATSISAFFNFFFLAKALSNRIGPLFSSDVLKGFVKTASCTMIAGVITLALGYFLVGDPTVNMVLGKDYEPFVREFSKQLLQLFVLSGSFVLLLFSYAWVINVEDLLSLIGMNRRRNAVEVE